MATIKNKGCGFTQVSNGLLEDPRLSYKAKGLYCYMASRPDNWQFFETQLQSVSTEGRDAVKAALKELVNAGWLHRSNETVRKGGKFSSYVYEIVHRDGLTAADEPLRFNRCGKPATNNTDINNTDKNNTDNILGDTKKQPELALTEKENDHEPTKPKAKRSKPSKTLAAIYPAANPENSGWLPAECWNFAAKHGLTDKETHTECLAFYNHHTAKGSSFKDWTAAWRTWILSPYRKAGKADARNSAGKSTAAATYDTVMDARYG